MARLLRAQLNQIRAWVRQGRTDAWIAHQLDVSTSELRDFRRRHDLNPDDEPDSSEHLRDEIEAEVEAATLADEDEEEPAEDEDEEREDEEREDDEREDARADDEAEDDASDADDQSDDERPRRRRRRRRGGRGRRGGAKPIEATFDHGEDEGYGLWLDPAVKEHPAYVEHWRGKRAVEVTIEPDRITIRRSDG